MGITLMPLYYHEPSVYVYGKYAKDITLDEIIEVLKKYIEKHGKYLVKIVIKKNFKRKPAEVRVLYDDEEGFRRRLYHEPRRFGFEYYRVAQDGKALYLSKDFQVVEEVKLNGRR